MSRAHASHRNDHLLADLIRSRIAQTIDQRRQGRSAGRVHPAQHHRRVEANEELHDLAARIAGTGAFPIVEAAFLELAEPEAEQPPELSAAEEQARMYAKLREIGITPNIIACRCEKPLDKELRQKISMFCKDRSSIRKVDIALDPSS